MTITLRRRQDDTREAFHLVLRVISDDKVVPGRGLAQDMVIISYVNKGAIEHKDSMGHIETLSVGELQLLEAGTGVTH